MKKRLKKIELRKKTVSLLNQSASKQMNGGATRINESCHKACPTLEPDCGLSIQPNSCMNSCACFTVGCV
jgi:hypothetical protein